MKYCRRIISILGFLFMCNLTFAQRDISGTWEGIMDDELLQINIQQKGDSLCGFTYDYILDNRQNHCRARFTGYYNRTKRAFFLTGNSFIENVGGHSLMIIRMLKMPEDAYDTITAWVAIKSIFGFSLVDEEGYKLRKVSNRPAMAPYMEPCFPLPPKKKPAVKPVLPPAVKTKPKTDTVRKTTPPLLKKDTLSIKKVPPKTAVQKENTALLKQLNTRKNTEQSRIVIDDSHINLKLYDNGTVDGDTVSVFYNGRLLINNKRLSEKPIEISLDLDTTVIYHEITLFANNLGSIPPNTALIIATTGGKRYELRSKASLVENAVLVFEYRKKD